MPPELPNGQLANRMTPSQYVIAEVGGKAEAICALLGDLQAMAAIDAEKTARIAELEKENADLKAAKQD